MRSFLLITMMILLYTMQSLFCKIYNDNYPGKKNLSSSVFAIATGLTVTLVSCIFAGFSFNFSKILLLMGILNGITLMLYDFAIIGATAHGPYSVLMVFMIAGGIIVPTAVSWIFLDVPFSLIHLVCIFVTVFAVYLVSKKQGESYADRKKFFFECLLLGITNGIYGSVFKVQEYLSGQGIIPAEEKGLVAVTYAVAAALSFIILAVKYKKDGIKAIAMQNKKSLIFLIICGIIMSLAINLMVKIIPLVNVAVLYTLDNSCVFLLSVICSCIFFKEKLSKTNITGCIILCAALVCISVF